jgi:hypothetical protein
MCEDAFDMALDHPGILIPIFRQEHTSIVRTTRRTFFEQVVPPELLAACDTKNSQGEDWIRFPNGSQIEFCGLSDPIRWFSSELGAVFFDEAQEMPQEYVVKLITRLRQRCKTCIAANERDCQHMPHTAALGFNPDNPGHWLYQWFLDSSQRTKYGFYKPELFVTDEQGATGDEPLGDCEFVFAKASDNPYLSDRYMKTLRGMPPALRKRYLEGLWEFTSGRTFFTEEALEEYQRRCLDSSPRFYGRTEGDVEADMKYRLHKGQRPEDKCRLVPQKNGPLAVYQPPVRTTSDGPGHRYVMGIDVSSGGSKDYSAICVVDVEDWGLVARWQGKITPTELAIEAYRLGRVYNNALAAPEVTGGWGFTVDQELKRYRYIPTFTRKRFDRIARKWTDFTGWDTTVKTRAHMLDTLDRVLREGDFFLEDMAVVNELATFVRNEVGKPEAQPGCNDDLVMSLAIAVTVAADMPRTLIRMKQTEHRPAVSSVTGY